MQIPRYRLLRVTADSASPSLSPLHSPFDTGVEVIERQHRNII